MPTATEREVVESHLSSIESDEGVSVVEARDVGSRARNTHSESSDYDVMFVFCQNPIDYISSRFERDTIERTVGADESDLDREIEFDGWNISKFVGSNGLAGSNPTALEFVGSDEVYSRAEAGRVRSAFDACCTHGREQFTPYALICHYRSMAASNYHKYIESGYTLSDDTSWSTLFDRVPVSEFPSMYVQEQAVGNMVVDEERSTIGDDAIEVVGTTTVDALMGSIPIVEAREEGLIEPTTSNRTVKRYLVVCRALLSSRYVEETHELPPMDTRELCRWAGTKTWCRGRLYSRVMDLIGAKCDGSGGTELDDEPILGDFIEAELDCDVQPHAPTSSEQTYDHVGRSPDVEVIDHEARSCVRAATA